MTPPRKIVERVEKPRPVRHPVDLLDYEIKPRPHPLPVPAVGVFADPRTCVTVNKSWLSHVTGVLNVLLEPDAWSGDEATIESAHQQVQLLLTALVTGTCETEAPMITGIRFVDCVMEYTVDGLIWLPVSGFDEACFTGPPGPQGPQGPEGPPGSTGPQGPPGQDCNCDQTPTETPGEDGDAKRCNLASYLVEIPLPSTYQQLVAQRQASADLATLVAGVLGLAATILTVVGTGGAAIPAFLAAGLSIGAGGASVGAVLAAANPTDLTNEATPQFWLDVKCAIYCAIPADGRLTADVTIACADAVGEMTDTYPNAALLVREMLLGSNPEALAQYSVVGALYSGDNCDLCECGACDSANFAVHRYNWNTPELLGTRGCYASGAFTPCSPYNSVQVADQIAIDLGSPHCLRFVRFSEAGNGNVDWRDVEYRLDGVVVGAETDIDGKTSCPGGTSGWSGSIVFDPPLTGQVVEIVPTRKIGSNQAAAIDVHCVDIEWGD